MVTDMGGEGVGMLGSEIRVPKEDGTEQKLGSAINLSTKAEWYTIICLGTIEVAWAAFAVTYLLFLSPTGWAIDDTVVSLATLALTSPIMIVIGFAINSIADKRKLRQDRELSEARNDLSKELVQASNEITVNQGEQNRQVTKKMAEEQRNLSKELAEKGNEITKDEGKHNRRQMAEQVRINATTSFALAAVGAGVTPAGAILLVGATLASSGQTLPEFLQSCKSIALFCRDFATIKVSSLYSSLVAHEQLTISAGEVGTPSQVHPLPYMEAEDDLERQREQLQGSAGNASAQEEPRNIFSSWRSWGAKLSVATALIATYLCRYQADAISFYLGPSSEMTYPNVSSTSSVYHNRIAP